MLERYDGMAMVCRCGLGKAEPQVGLLNTTGEHVAERKLSHPGMGFAELTTWWSEPTKPAETARLGIA